MSCDGTRDRPAQINPGPPSGLLSVGGPSGVLRLCGLWPVVIGGGVDAGVAVKPVLIRDCSS
ncbi:MAG: hypothetical protein KME19_22570 [Microcoleus vaginatus WJT46-NPBG5]|nr:hypothetical protein [Microcoleus vaginatus WJT46-NPBG5]